MSRHVGGVAGGVARRSHSSGRFAQVHGRVTDIWRAYFTQRLLWDLGMRIAFSLPWVTQIRNVHNILGDFNSEVPLYQQARRTAHALAALRGVVPGPRGRSAAACVAGGVESGARARDGFGHASHMQRALVPSIFTVPGTCTLFNR